MQHNRRSLSVDLPSARRHGGLLCICPQRDQVRSTASPAPPFHLGRAMLEPLHVAYANFAAIEPTIQQAVGMLLLSTAAGALGAGIAIGGIWMRYIQR